MNIIQDILARMIASAVLIVLAPVAAVLVLVFILASAVVVWIPEGSDESV